MKPVIQESIDQRKHFSEDGDHHELAQTLLLENGYELLGETTYQADANMAGELYQKGEALVRLDWGDFMGFFTQLEFTTTDKPFALKLKTK